jgi:hypothetical protein
MTEDKRPRRRHRRTGRPTGAPRGNTNSVRHGTTSAAAVARRKAVNDVLRAARRALREAD